MLDGVTDQPGMPEVTVASPGLGVIRPPGSAARHQDLTVRQRLDVGDRERCLRFEDGDARPDLRSVPLLRVGSLTVVAGDAHSMLARRRLPRRHGDVIEADPNGDGPIG